MRCAACSALLLIASIFNPTSVFAIGSVTLEWGPSSDPNVVGYKIYYGATSGTYTNVVDVGNNTSVTIGGLVDGVTYYFAATAYNILGMESEFSNETTYAVPGPPVNQPPTLNAIANVTINEGAGQQTVALSGITAGAPNENQTLTVTASSSNTGLIPNPAVNYTSPNTNGSLTFTPVAFAYGTATITVTVNDGIASNNIVTRTFTVTVNSVNQAPTLNPVSNVTINQNAPQQLVNLTGIGSGAPNESQTLTVAASSSNTGLIPHPTVTYSSPGATGSLRFTPVTGAAGSATITVTVNDGGASNNVVTRTFTVTVNGAPTISTIAAQTIATNMVAGPVNFTVGDAETPAGNLTLAGASSATTLITTTGIVFGGSGANRTVTLTPLPAKSGTATISVIVSDGSLTATQTFLLTVLASPTPPGSLTVVTNGAGAVTLSASKDRMFVGKTYTATATPSSGQIFVGWSGSVTSSVTKVTFVMTSNLVLRANFKPSPYIPIAGKYNGLFYEAAGIQTHSAGSFNAVVTSQGRYTGRLQIGGRRHSISGQLDPDCRATNVIVRIGTNSLVVELDAGTNNPSDHMVGRVTDGVWVSDLAADRAVFSMKGTPAPLAGAYTLVVPGQFGDPNVPAGDGFGSLRIDHNGTVRFGGILADGTKFSQSSVVSKNGEWPFHSVLYSGKGLAMSWLTFANQSTSDLYGPMTWIKPTNSLAKYYPNGFTNDVMVTGSAYIRPGTGTNLLSFTNGLVLFQGGGLGSNFFSTIMLNPGNKLVDLSSNGLSMSFSLPNGTFKGKVIDPSTGTPMTFNGAVLQKLNVGLGFGLKTNQSSLVTIMP